MIDRQPQSPDPQPRIPFVSDVLHFVAMTALVWLRSSFGFVFLSSKAVFFAFSWAFILTEIIAWHYDFIWRYVRALCIFGNATVCLYWLHLLRSWSSELLKSAGHDNYAGTSHLLRIVKGFGIAPSKTLEWTLCIGVEPAAVLIVAFALRHLSSAPYLSLWLYVTAAAMCAKEGLNYWFELRRDKRLEQLRRELEQQAKTETASVAESSEPAKTTGKAPQNRPRVRAGTTADEEERRHADVLQLPASYDLQIVKQHFRDLIKETHPDRNDDSAESTSETSALYDALDYFRKKFQP